MRWNGSWSTRATLRRTRTPAEREAEIRESLAQKGAQHQDTSGRGCARCAGQMRCYRRRHGCLKSENLSQKVVSDVTTNRRIDVQPRCCLRMQSGGARGLIADRAYDSDKIVKSAENLGMKVVIPPRKNRKIQRKYDKKVYKIRRLVENAFMYLKRWRGIATRYCKNLSSFLAAVQIRCLAVWGNVS